MEVAGFLETPDGKYRHHCPESCVDLTCQIDGCVPTVGLLPLQDHYADPPAPEDEIMSLFWVNGETDYANVHLSVNQTPLGTVGGNWQGVTIMGIAPGDYTFGVQGDCGAPQGPASVTELAFEVLPESPHPRPVAAPIEMVWDEGTTTTTATWTHAEPSAFINVYISRTLEDELEFQERLPGDATSVTVPGVVDPDNDLVRIIFYKQVDNGFYASPWPLSFDDQAYFIRGVTDNNGVMPSITSAIFLLKYLFQGGDKPPCMEACNVDGNEDINLTDAVYLLLYLFRGGPPPPTWDDPLTALCEAVQALQVCDVGNSNCSGPGPVGPAE